MPLIKDGKPVDDPFVEVGDEGSLPDAPVIVSQTRWEAERDALAARNHPIGIRIANDADVAALAGDLDRFALVVLEFPKFSDGRAYSQARLLRERHRFAGELRATGEVLRDQFLFMQRCGIDAFEVSGAEAAGWQNVIKAISVVYQPAADARRPALWVPRGGEKGKESQGPASPVTGGRESVAACWAF